MTQPPRDEPVEVPVRATVAPRVKWLPPAGASRVGWALLCLLAAACAGWSLVAFFRGPFTGLIDSDAAVPPLLAAEMLRTRAWVPASWYYVNDDIWLLGPQLFALPFVSAWGPTSAALAAGNVFGLAMTGVLVFLLSRRVTGSNAASILATLGVLAPFSRIQRDVVYVQLAYGWIFGYLCLLLYLALRTVERAASTVGEVLSRRALWLYALLVALLFAGSTARGLVYWLVPVLGASLLEGRSARTRVQCIALALSSAGAAVVGTAIHFLLRFRLHSKAWDAPFRTAGGWGRKLETAWHGIPWLIGTPADTGSAWLSEQGLLAAVRAAFLAGAVVALFLIWRRGETPSPLRLAARIASLMLGSVSVAFVLGRMVSSPLNIRYFLPPAFLGLVALLGLCGRWLGQRSFPFLVVTAVFAAGFVGGGALRAAAMQSTPHSPCAGPPRLCEPLEAARAHGVSVGFSTYWNANALTLASGGSIRVCPIRLEPPLRPDRWLTSSECFLEDGYRGAFFVLLESSEMDSTTSQTLTAAMGPPTHRGTVGEFELWLYEPLATRGWAWLSR